MLRQLPAFTREAEWPLALGPPGLTTCSAAAVMETHCSREPE